MAGFKEDVFQLGKSRISRLQGQLWPVCVTISSSLNTFVTNRIAKFDDTLSFLEFFENFLTDLDLLESVMSVLDERRSLNVRVSSTHNFDTFYDLDENENLDTTQEFTDVRFIKFMIEHRDNKIASPSTSLVNPFEQMMGKNTRQLDELIKNVNYTMKFCVMCNRMDQY